MVKVVEEMSKFSTTWGNEGRQSLPLTPNDIIPWDSMKRQRLSIIPYTGGKLGLVPNIVPLIEGVAKQYNLYGYIEAYGGGGRMLLNIDPKLFKHRIYNDLDYSLCSLFKVLGEKHLTIDLMKKLNRQDYCETVFNKAKEMWERDNNLADEGRFEELSDFVTAAANAYVLTHQSYRASMRSYGSSIEWQKRERYFDRLKNLDKFVPILSGVEVIRWDGRKLLEEYGDRSDYFIYLDPPYDPKTMKGKNHYKNSLTEEDHKKIIEQAKDVASFVAISSYDSELYDVLYKKYGWRKPIFLKDKHVGMSITGGRAEEYLYINFDISDELEELISEGKMF